jgi:transmembrane sensor
LQYEALATGGIVEISQAGRDAFLLDANKSAEVDLNGHESRIRDINSDQLSQELARREGKIALIGQTLAEAAEEFNRYNSRPIIVGPGPDKLGVVGWYSANDPASFAQAVGTSMDLDVRTYPDHIMIESQGAGSESEGEPRP